MVPIHKKRGRSSKTELQAAYEAGRRDAATPDIKAAEAAGFQRAFELFNQALRFLKWESSREFETLSPETNLKQHDEPLRGGEASPASGSGGGGLPGFQPGEVFRIGF